MAVLGSLVASHYASAIGRLPGFDGPTEQVARRSLGAALQVAAGAGERGPELAAAARSAFVDAIGLAYSVAAAVVLVAAVMIARFMPARDDPRSVHDATLDTHVGLATGVEAAPEPAPTGPAIR